MKGTRVLSTETNIYHRASCIYSKRIMPKNRMEMGPFEAKKHGYRPCKCCNTMKFLYDRDISTLDYYKRKMAMDYKMVDGILYIKTEVSCWKLVYSRREEKIFLYHRNKSSQPLNFDLPQMERYHRQTDVQPSASINKHLRYIYEHDRYRAAEAKGEKLVTFTSERSRILAARAERKMQRKRIDNLFAILEASNQGYRELSYC